MPALYTIILLSIDPFHPTGNGRGLEETSGLIPMGVVPFVETDCSDVRSVSAVFKSDKSVIPPGTGEVNGSFTNAFFASKEAAAEQEAIFLFQTVGRGG